MPMPLKDFQRLLCDGIVAQFGQVRALYRQIAAAAPERIDEARRKDAVIVLQAPTGAGKTRMAIEVLRRVSTEERVLWFWFAPFTGLVEQSRNVLANQAPELALLDLEVDRQLDAVRGGGVFVVTWASLAARNAESRRARQRGDEGMSIDGVIALAREAGLRIGCVVDEAHHGFQRAAQARAFFCDVLKPDYALLMTATPRDADMAAFARATGYSVGEPADWASVSRADAVDAGLLKRGVRMVRFIARDGDTAQLVDFEHLALRECAQTHRAIRISLAEAGVALTPLMLVQVPNGKAAQEAARIYLVEQLGFDATAVRIHTADEPDPDLLLLAQDPTVEVLIFKMAVALGFDAPRAFTLAALRGARDVGFGVQVIGRIVRRHALLQARADLPPLLDHGYVFLANSESQEGLLQAGAQINTLTTQAPELGTQTVVTMIGDGAALQVVRSGEPLSLLVSSAGVQILEADEGSAAIGQAGTAGEVVDMLAGTAFAGMASAAQAALEMFAGEGAWPARATPVADAFVLAQDSMYRYPRRADAPDRLRGEQLPPVAVDFEARLAAHVDFSAEVLADRLRGRVQVQRRDTDLFAGDRVADDGTDLWATLSPEAVADKAEQIRLRLVDANDRELYVRLLDRFIRAIEASGADIPDNEELQMRQLDLLLVRRPGLLRDAFRRLRMRQVMDVDVPLLAELASAQPLRRADRALYGVFPAGLNQDELAIAERLDGSAQVRWWHRNLPKSGVGLYRWDEGNGFYPDFVVCMAQRAAPGIALLELKGEHLWGAPTEVDKSLAAHRDYGPVFMVGRKRGERDFFYLRELGGRLQSAGSFDLDRMRFT
ncbi:helicase SNF2 [Xanthomonas hyacinthi]|uniref:Helicase SNF2 n=1 Tax=Xanthomonas hyacinthi TaxID=56455 RepID=A0A2S7EYL4_9XANT|nr:DEAD/DEAH box helicase family protein [Xanthomonas hyacinthi]KLD76825.1 helicase SNF2 [Xanthomonas hyacinthi DSM 19077]PPU98226.1 helicase SNF2 [Xanthomonas hyacinthi]QGY76721.1 helicase SNF2 [Xanthomonas hyacinthi]